VAETVRGDLDPVIVQRVLARLGMAHRRLKGLTEAEAVLTHQVRVAGKGGGFYQEVPRLEGNVHDLDALRKVSDAIFAPAREL
jgi:hypothetical protein